MSYSIEERIGDWRAAIEAAEAVRSRFPDVEIRGGEFVSASITREKVDVVEPVVRIDGERKRVYLRGGVRVGKVIVWASDYDYERPFAATVLERLMADPNGRAVLLAAMKGA